MIRIGVGPIAASAVAFATGFITYLWLMTGPLPVNAASGVHARVHSAFDAIDPALLDAGGTAGSNVQVGFNARFASLDAANASRFVLDRTDDRAEPGSAATPFGERFSFEQSGESVQFSASFDDRFAVDHETTGTVRSAAAAPRANVQRVAAAALMPRARPADAPRRALGRMQLASASATSLPLSYAPTDSVTSPAMGSALKELTPKSSKPRDDGDKSRTAIYDITARTVYLPNGRRLEAHSGLGDHMDNPRYADKRMTGPTPPNVYNLRMRESLFKGVRAIRLIPTDNAKMNGRAGILAHTYMLGPSGASNGCISIKDYDAFLNAFERGEINRIVVVERLGDPPPHQTVAEWFRDLFRS